MRISWTHLFVATSLVLVVCSTVTEARKGKKRNRGKAGVCKYRGKATEGPCDPNIGKTITYNLKRGKSASNCDLKRVFTVNCDDNSHNVRKGKKNRRNKRCKYERKGVRGPCDLSINTLTVTRTLKDGKDASCPPTKIKIRKCRNKDLNGGNRSCVYQKQPWSECDIVTQVKERTLVRVSGDEHLCLPKKIVTKRCAKVCRFDKGEWSECDSTTHKMHRRLTPRSGSPAQCKLYTQTRDCHQAELTAAKAYKCRYRAGRWSACDPRSDTITKLWKLKSGDANVCPQSKNLTKKCESKCRFSTGIWSECGIDTEMTTRVDTLIKGSTKHCDQTRTITKKCKKACKYEWGDWSECNTDTNQRSRDGKLNSQGDPMKCRPTNIMYRSCTNRRGEDQCFFGSWGEFGPCQNGVMTKHRPVVQGGVECERKAAMNRACDEVAIQG